MDNQQPSGNLQWKTVCENDRYEVNQKGEVRYKKRKRILTPLINPGGYAYVSFNMNGERRRFAIHRIVANAFIPNPNNYSEVNHKNYDRLNNNVENLEWISSSQNKQHAYLKKENHDCRGKVVMQFDKSGVLIKKFSTVRETAKSLNCTIGAISNCCSGRLKLLWGIFGNFRRFND